MRSGSTVEYTANALPEWRPERYRRIQRSPTRGVRYGTETLTRKTRPCGHERGTCERLSAVHRTLFENQSLNTDVL